MKGKVIRVVTFGNTTMYLIWLKDMNVYGRTYTGKGFRNFINWKDLKTEDLIDGLKWKNETDAILDADSPVHVTG